MNTPPQEKTVTPPTEKCPKEGQPHYGCGKCNVRPFLAPPPHTTDKGLETYLKDELKRMFGNGYGGYLIDDSNMSFACLVELIQEIAGKEYSRGVSVMAGLAREEAERMYPEFLARDCNDLLIQLSGKINLAALETPS